MKLVTVSGIDGAGKSTQVRFVESYVRKRGCATRSVEFNRLGLTTILISIGFLPRVNRRYFLEESPSVGNRDWSSAKVCYTQHRNRSLVRFRRFVTYLIDAVVFRVYTWVLWFRGVEVLICDRYAYDKLANLPNPRSVGVRLLRLMFPTPDVAFLLRVDADQAMSRRREASRDFYATKIAAYDALCEVCPELLRIESEKLSEAQGLIADRLGDLFAPLRSPAG